MTDEAELKKKFELHVKKIEEGLDQAIEDNNKRNQERGYNELSQERISQVRSFISILRFGTYPSNSDLHVSKFLLGLCINGPLEIVFPFMQKESKELVKEIEDFLKIQD